MRTIYLDYNATTPIAPVVQEAMLPFLAEHYGNPSSGHSLGRACQEAVRDARQRVAQLLGCDRDEIVFTSGGTEANNLAIKGVAFRHGPGAAGHLVISAFEHPAVVEPVRFLERLGYDVSVVKPTPRGVIEPQAVRAALRADTVLVSVMHANNEIGTIQPLRKIAEICQEQGVLLHSDAAQSCGKIPTRIADLGVDLLSIAGHKLYAPKGVGALFVRHGVALEPLLHGAEHEGGMRAGTENVAAIVGLGQAASQAAGSLDDSQARLTMLRDRLLERLRDGVGKRLTVNGQGVPRLPNTLSVNFPGVDSSELLRRCPELCASVGSACHSGTGRLSSTQAAIGLSPEQAKGTIRLSVGWFTSEEDIDRAAGLILSAYEAFAERMKVEG